VGLLFLLALAVVASNTARFTARASKARGTVVDLVTGRGYHPVIKFTTQDKRQVTFVSSIGSSPPRFKKGHKVRVIYDPRRPSRARINSGFAIWLPAVLLALGTVAFGGSGTVMVLAALRRLRMNEWLRKFGRPIGTEYQAVTVDRTVSLNGRHPYRIVTQWRNPATGVYYSFLSPNIWFDPEPYAAGRNIVVRIDPAKPKRYLMDIEFLPKVPAEQT